MRDGIILSADIYRPDAEGKFPVLLTRTYYGKFQHDIFHDNDNLSACSSKEFIEYFVPRGYVVVIQDCRGRFDSEGEFYPEIYDAEVDMTPKVGAALSHGPMVKSAPLVVLMQEVFNGILPI